MKNELLYLVWLTLSTSFSQAGSRLLDTLSPSEIYELDQRGLEEHGASEGLVSALSNKSLDRAHRTLALCSRAAIAPIPFFDPLFPEKLKGKKDAPRLIYVKGDVGVLDKGVKIGFVGTREVSRDGRIRSAELAEKLASRGAVMISGGARGADSIALIAALDAGAYPVAVLGCDIDKFYPASNYSLLTLVAEKGAVISEYPPETGARFFPARNRIIAALSDRVVIAEAPIGSGALITASYAVRYGVPLFAVDGEGESFAGCRELIKNGAAVASSAEDVLLAEPKTAPTPKKSTAPRHAPTARRPVASESVPVCQEEKERVFPTPILEHVYRSVKKGYDTPERMVTDRFGITDILCALTELELEGAIKAAAGGRYEIK